MPVQEANRFRSANLVMGWTSASTRATTIAPKPGSVVRDEPLASTMALRSLVRVLIFFSIAIRSASSSAAIRLRVLPASSRGRTDASFAPSQERFATDKAGYAAMRIRRPVVATNLGRGRKQ